MNDRTVVAIPFWLYTLGVFAGVAIVGAVAVIAMFFVVAAGALALIGLIIVWLVSLIRGHVDLPRIPMPQRRPEPEPDFDYEERRVRENLYPLWNVRQAAMYHDQPGVVRTWPMEPPSSDAPTVQLHPDQEVLFP